MGRFGGMEEEKLKSYKRVKGPYRKEVIRPICPFRLYLHLFLFLGMTFRAEGRASRLALFFIFPVTIPTGIVKGLFGGDLGVLFVATCALLNLSALLVGMMALLALFARINMLLVPERSPFVYIRCVKPGIVDGEGILLTEDALQDEQGSKEYNRGDN